MFIALCRGDNGIICKCNSCVCVSAGMRNKDPKWLITDLLCPKLSHYDHPMETMAGMAAASKQREWKSFTTRQRCFPLKASCLITRQPWCQALAWNLCFPCFWETNENKMSRVLWLSIFIWGWYYLFVCLFVCLLSLSLVIHTIKGNLLTYLVVLPEWLCKFSCATSIHSCVIHSVARVALFFLGLKIFGWRSNTIYA